MSDGNVITDEDRAEWRKRAAEARPTSYEGSRRMHGAGYRLTPEEKRRVSLQLGEPVEDYAHLKRLYREQGLRDLERGEPAMEKKKILAEWAMNGAKGPCPTGHHGLEVKPRDRPSRLAEYIERKKREGRRE